MKPMPRKAQVTFGYRSQGENYVRVGAGDAAGAPITRGAHTRLGLARPARLPAAVRLTAVLALALLMLLPGNGRGAHAGRPLTLGQTGLHGPHPFLTVLCRFAGTKEYAAPPSQFAWLLGDRYPGLGDYWRTVSYGAISLEGSALAGWYTLPADRSTYVRSAGDDEQGAGGRAGADLQRLAQDCAGAAGNDVDWSRYFGINLVFNEELGESWGGQACLTLAAVSKCFGATWLGPSAYANQAIWAHEMGHAFGLSHSGSGQNAYANVWDLMSGWGPCWPEQPYGQVAQEPIAYQKDMLGWIPLERQFSAEPDTETHVRLTRLSSPGSDGYMLARIPIEGSPSHFYTVEARRRTGYDVHLPGDAVVIHEVDTRRALPAQPVNPPSGAQVDEAPDKGLAAGWTPGSTFTDVQHAISVSIDEATPAGFAVTIRTGWITNPGASHAVPISTAQLGEVAASTVWDSSGTEYRLSSATAQEDRQADPDGGVLFERRAPVGNWGDAEQVSEAGLGSHHLRPAMAVDGSGNIYAAWEDNRRGPFDIYFAFRPATGTWTKSARIDGDGEYGQLAPALAVNSLGSAVAAWVDYRGEHAAIYAAYRPAGGGWETGVRVSEAVAGKTAEPAVGIDRDGNQYAAWIGYPDCPSYRGVSRGSLYLSARPAAGGPSGNAIWRKPVVVSEGTATSPSWPRLLLDYPGGLQVVWQEDGHDHQARYSITELLGR